MKNNINKIAPNSEDKGAVEAPPSGRYAAGAGGASSRRSFLKRSEERRVGKEC